MLQTERGLEKKPFKPVKIDEKKEQEPDYLSQIEAAAQEIVPKLPEVEHQEISLEATEKALEIMKKAVFAPVDKYQIMASTALYLHSRELRSVPGQEDRKLIPPGDLDVVVFDRDEFNQIIERLSNLAHREPDVESVNIEAMQRVSRSEDTEVARGTMVFKQGGELHEYPFEFFLNDQGTHRLINPDTFKMSSNVDSLNILDTEGLKRQYIENFNLENRQFKQVEKILEYITNNSEIKELINSIFEQRLKNGEWPADENYNFILEHYGISGDDLAMIYRLNSELQQAYRSGDEEQVEMRRGQISKILSGQKSKLAKRSRNIQALNDLRSIELNRPQAPEYIN